MEHARPPPELTLEGGPANRADSWRKWLKQFKVFLKASGVYKEPADVQASLLINLIGADGYDVYTTFKFDKEADRDCINKLIEKFDQHFGSKTNVIMLRFKFFTRNQEAGESIDEYVTALRIISQQCEFEKLEDGLLRDRIVCGIRDSVVRDRLLRTDDLTLEKAIRICQSSEITSEESRQIEGVKSETRNNMSVDALGSRSGYGRGAARRGGRWARGGGGGAGASGSDRERLCAACADRFCDGGPRCAARSAKCFLCGFKGHYKKVCPGRKSSKVYQLQEDNDDLYYLDTIQEIDHVEDSKWYEILQLLCSDKIVKHKVKLDSGSDLNVLSKNNFIKLGFLISDIDPDNIKAQSFCGNYISVIGSCVIKCIYKENEFLLRFVISNNDCQSILGKYALEQLGLVKRIYSVNVEEFDDLFCGLGKIPGQYKIPIQADACPCICPVRKIPLGVRDQLQTELTRMENLGVIRKVTHPTAWVNAIVMAAKKDGTFRVCLDPRPLNRVIRRQHYPLPTVTEIATKLKGACYFSKLDARSGFWMIELDDDSADLCTFGTPFGRYQFLRLPYGINSASEVFHSKIRQLLEDLEGVDSFVDDVIVWGASQHEHDSRLRSLLERARQVGIKFNRDKCEFRVSEVTYLGHTFNSEGVKIDDRKLKAIKEMPSPSDRQSLERFLGMVNYVAKFLPNHSEQVAPLRNLLKQDSEWCWGESEEQRVRALKQALCAAPVLALFDPAQPCVLSVDASSLALGAVLLQESRPVEFASATLSDTQGRYAQIEKEMLAIVFALERFHQYVYGKSDVVVETDHKPLEALFKKSLDAVPSRLQRMMLRVQRYDFTVVYKPGKYMFIADTLSRAPIPEVMSDKVTQEVDDQTCFLLRTVRFSDNKMDAIKQSTRKDKVCQVLINYIKNGWPDSKHKSNESVRALWDCRECLEYADGVLFKNNLVYIPSDLRSEMISRVHEGHLGIDRCKRRAREVMFWPGMSRDVELAVRRCRACAQHAPAPQREPMVPHQIPGLPWAKIGSDIFEYKNKHYLIIVDYFSNFVEVCPLKSINSASVILAMRDQFARHGIPSELISDNGSAYSSKEFKKFADAWGFRHSTSSPTYAQSNGRSERTVRTIKMMLKKSLDTGSDFYLGLLNYRATPRDGIGSPAQLLMGRRLNTRLPVHDSKLEPDRDNTTDYANILRNQWRSKQWHDERARELPELRPGDDVIALDGGGGRRRAARVSGRAAQPRSYFVTDANGKRYRRNRRHLIKLEPEFPSPSSSQHEIVNDDDETDSSDDEIYDDVEESLDPPADIQDQGTELPTNHASVPGHNDIAPQRIPRAAALEAKRKLKQ